jgi:hypothetical protein
MATARAALGCAMSCRAATANLAALGFCSTENLVARAGVVLTTARPRLTLVGATPRRSRIYAALAAASLCCVLAATKPSARRSAACGWQWNFS